MSFKHHLFKGQVRTGFKNGEIFKTSSGLIVRVHAHVCAHAYVCAHVCNVYAHVYMFV